MLIADSISRIGVGITGLYEEVKEEEKGKRKKKGKKNSNYLKVCYFRFKRIILIDFLIERFINQCVKYFHNTLKD